MHATAPGATQTVAGTPLRAAAVALLVLPWLNPFAAGPSPSVEPWLFSLACALVLRALFPRDRLRGEVLAVLALLAGWTLLRSGATLDSLALAGGCAVIAMAGGVSAQWDREGAEAILPTALALAAATSTVAALSQYFGAAEALAPWVTGSPGAEAFANLRQRNQFACLTVIGTAAVVWHPRPGTAAGWRVAAVAWLAIGNAATTSRTGLLQLVVLLVLAAWWRGGARRERIATVAAALAAYALAAVMLPWVSDALGGAPHPLLWERVADGTSCSSRRVLWSNVVELIAQRPLLGWGWGELDHAHYMHLYAGPRFCDILDNAHSLPLHLAVELGVPVTLLLLAAVAGLVVAARPWSEARSARQFAWAVLAALAIHSLLEYPLWYGPFQLAFGACLGLLAPAQRAESGWKVTLLVAAAVGLAGLYAMWDYRRVSQIYLPAEERVPRWRDDTAAHVGRSWLFAGQARFALLTTAPLTRENARDVADSAEQVLHYSPEPRVIEKAIESETMLGRTDEALLHLARFRAAFPDAYAEWASRNGLR